MIPATTSLPSNEEVRRANRTVYNRKTVAEYDQNESIFSLERQREICATLQELRSRSGGTRFLDLGCGTGNLMRLAASEFEEVIGLDQAERLLAQVLEKNPEWRLLSGRADRIPLAEASIDVVGMYALLHHLRDPRPALVEAFRILAPGGMVYTDHDPNRAFWRFHGLMQRLSFRGKRQTFGSDLEDVAEFHHTYSDGLDPKGLAAAMEEIGFEEVEVRYRQTMNRGLSGIRRWVAFSIDSLSRVVEIPSLYTHFQLIARKPKS